MAESAAPKRPSRNRRLPAHLRDFVVTQYQESISSSNSTSSSHIDRLVLQRNGVQSDIGRYIKKVEACSAVPGQDLILKNINKRLDKSFQELQVITDKILDSGEQLYPLEIGEAVKVLGDMKEKVEDTQDKIAVALHKANKAPTKEQSATKTTSRPHQTPAPPDVRPKTPMATSTQIKKEPNKAPVAPPDVQPVTREVSMLPEPSQILPDLTQDMGLDFDIAKSSTCAPSQFAESGEIRRFFQGVAKPRLPKFTGERGQFNDWWEQFDIFVNQADVPVRFKMVMLKNSLSGAPADLVKQLGYTEIQYQMAIAKLHQRYGGERRLLQQHIEAITSTTPVKEDNLKGLSDISNKIYDIAGKLKDAGQGNELIGNSALYTIVLQKIPDSLLIQYQNDRSRQEPDGLMAFAKWLNRQVSIRIEMSELKESLKKTRSENDLKSKARPWSREKPNRSHSNATKTKPETQKKPTSKTTSGSTSTSEQKCPVCQGTHNTIDCSQWKKASVQDRWSIAKDRNICYRCLQNGHLGRNCTSTKKCGIENCEKTHHRSLHPLSSNEQKSLESQSQKRESRSNFGINSEGRIVPAKVALRLLPVYLIGKGGHKRKVQAFLDDGSDSSYVRADVARALGIIVEEGNLTISTLVDQNSLVPSGLVKLELESLDGSTRGELGARTLESMCEGLHAPNWQKLKDNWTHLQGIKFPKIPGNRQVDILIGSDHPELTLALEERSGKPGEPVARKTPLGWTCVGPVKPVNDECTNVHVARAYKIDTGLESFDADEQLRVLWNMDVIVSKPTLDLTPDEQIAVAKADRSIEFEGERYKIGIPWKEDQPSLPDNRKAAEKRLRSLESSLKRKPEVAERYKEVFRDNLEKGYIREVPPEEVHKTGWYLPHFGVVKEERSTTKVRVVYDGAATYEGRSLNDEMLSGPKLQKDLVDILLKFRNGKIALVGDIKEMFSQIMLRPEDFRFHRILWRDLDTDVPIRTYESVRLPFGDRASPFLAQHVIRTHALRNQESYPVAAEVCLSNLYMDDALTAIDEVEQVKQLRRELTELLALGGFTCRKYCSNSVEVLQDIPEEDRAPGILSLEDSELPCMKALGAQWDAAKDVLGYSHVVVEIDVVTKRVLLSLVARLFDPLQLLAPYVVRAKILLQQAWIEGLEWDESFPPDLDRQVRAWVKELPSVELFEVPRCYHRETPVKSELHTFTDASSLAYGATVYVRNVYEDGSVSVQIMIAKARVAPLKAISIPRLELMAAVLGLRLAVKTKELLGYSSMQFWTDSMDVILWVHGQSRRYKPFVSHRVAEIQEHSSPQQWHHVPGTKNPADLASRGASIEDLIAPSCWVNGPEFLYQEESDWPKQKNLASEQLSEISQQEVAKSRSNVSELQDCSKKDLQQVSDCTPFMDINRFSSMTRLIRVTAWVFRFLRRLRSKDENAGQVLESAELEHAERYWISQTQRQYFGSLLQNMTKDKTCPSGSLKPLLPFVDREGFLRVRGRLENSNLPFDTKHPFIVPHQSHLATLIIRRAHLDRKHVGGTNGTLADIRQKYWIIHGREQVKKYERECVTCVMRKKRVHRQVMAPLPAHRVTVPIRAFAKVGVDYAGPYLVRISRKTDAKRWLCLFTCTTSRAVHLEVVYSMDTDGFLNAMTRMVARRGKPEFVVSDNGTNFVSAERELRELVAGLDQDRIVEDAANRGIEWHFNPPYGSHHGGMFEALIKSAKKALRSILGEARLTDEELLTAVVEVEGLLNSRPLTYCGDDVKDEPVLTPNHFLIGQSGGQLAPRIVEEVACSPRHRWKYVQQLVTSIWRRWNKEFLTLLQTRGKWLDVKEDMEIGDVVLVADPNNLKGRWPLGRVVEVFPCQDGHVRSVRVQSGGKVLVRPISRLCPLNIASPSQDQKVADTLSSGHGGESVGTMSIACPKMRDGNHASNGSGAVK